MSAKITLTVTQDDRTVQEVVFHRPSVCIVGRGRDCSLRLPNDLIHSTISRRHCLLKIDPPLIEIRDLGSLNGTYVNGEPIGRREADPAHREEPTDYPLRAGDQIQVGDVTLRVGVAVTLDDSDPGFDSFPHGDPVGQDMACAR